MYQILVTVWAPIGPGRSIHQLVLAFPDKQAADKAYQRLTERTHPFAGDSAPNRAVECLY